ncbi:ABC transporter ATP-binding protein/permease [Clostridia bacterium OttesenSCG-928-O13]|nr:ABC transporter ATP-binding protein/permease [Clostridia bacterium OttesenSCG-928-O13]
MARLRYLKDEDKAPKLSASFVQRIVAYFAPYKARVAGLVGLILLISAVGLLPTLLLRQIVDVALPEGNLTLLGLLVASSVGATVLVNLLRVGQGYLSTYISKKITYTMKNELYGHLSHMPAAFFAGVKPGEITTRMNSDVDGIQEVFRTTVVNAVNSVFMLGTTVLALFAMNWKLALIGLATVPLFILPTRKVGKIRWKIAAQSQEKLDELNQQVQESLSASGSTLMKLFSAEDREYEAFQHTNGEVASLQLKEALAGRWFRMAMDVFTTIGPMLVYFVGGIMLTSGEMSIGGILTFASLLGRLYSPVTQMSNIHIDFMRSFALFGRIFEYLDQKPGIEDGPLEAAITKGEVQFAHVDFSYGEEKQALSDISFSVKAGTTLALVGPSGAGKSTISNLIPRLYDVCGGRITVDGVDVRDMPLATLRGEIGMVMQEAYLFNGTIRDNLLYAKPGATQAELEQACKAAYIHDFIAALPGGYDTPVGNRGIKLSGGEKQRIAIARVILKDPKIVILDEATSALDSMSEHYIQKALGPLLQNRTAIVIAHRLSTIMGADEIIALQNGAVAERGTHARLLEKKGLYSKLYNTQFKNDKTRAA